MSLLWGLSSTSTGTVSAWKSTSGRKAGDVYPISLRAARTTSSRSSCVSPAELVVSPATITLAEATIVSQATRAIGSPRRMASRIESEMRSATLSGWPSVTDSLVKNRITAPLYEPKETAQTTAARRSAIFDITASATSRLVMSPKDSRRPSGKMMDTSLVSTPNPLPGRVTSLAAMKSTP